MMKYFPALCATALALTTLQVYALDCPTVDAVKAAADSLDTVTTVPQFTVFSSQPAIDDGDAKWFLQTFVSGANDQDEALTQGREAVQNVEEAITPEPIQFQGLSLCSYSTPEQAIVNTISVDLPGMKFNPRILPRFN